jgi:DNA polymerase III epsilon subunit-like protein
VTIGWWDRRLIAFDLETTAADPEQARIVTAAIVVAGGGLTTETFTALADPGVEVPDEAAAIHGVTTERARAEGRLADDVLDAVIAILSAHSTAPLVIYNARYDLTVLDRECRRHGRAPYAPRRVIDPLVIDKHLDRYRRGSRKLEAVCGHYGATLAGAHDAGHDAIAAARVAWCIGKRGSVVRRARNDVERADLAALEAEWSAVHKDLDALHAAQIRWAAEQADGLAGYFRSRGDIETAAGVRREWPVVPFDAATARAAA